MTAAAIYCRYSTDRQDPSSLEDQERNCRAFAAARGLAVVAVYGDMAVSGSHVRRAQLQKLLAEAKDMKLSAVIVDDLSRLSRDLIDTGNIVRSFAAKRISVLDVKTGSDSRDEASESLRFIEGFVGGEYIKAIRRQTHRGLEGRAMAGHATGGKAYGYSTVPSATPDRQQTVVDHEEAEVVRSIFTMTAEGKSTREIADRLNVDNIPAPHDGGKGHKAARGWGHTTIRSMLTSRRYLGEVTWNAHRWTKNHETGKRQREPRPAAEHVIRHYPELAIVPKELWDRVASTLPAPRKGVGGSRARALFPLSGLLLCGDCGGSFGAVSRVVKAGVVYRTLGCVTRKSRGDAICTNHHTISERKVMRALVDHLRDRLSRPDRVETFVAAFKAKFAAQPGPNEEREEMQATIARQQALIDNVLKALVAVPGSPALAAKLAIEEQKLAQLLRQLEAMPQAGPKVLPHPAAIASWVGRLTELIEAKPLEAAAVLRRVLTPFRVIHRNGGTRLVGALDLGVCESDSSGGVI